MIAHADMIPKLSFLKSHHEFVTLKHPDFLFKGYLNHEFSAMGTFYADIISHYGYGHVTVLAVPS